LQDDQFESIASFMNMLENDSAVMGKARDLCRAITGDAEYQEALGRVERFLENDEAKSLYQSVHEKGEALHQKQSAGVDLSDTEVAEFESSREQLFKNEVASDFHSAQQELQSLQQSLNKYIGMALELGRVPSDDELAEANGGGCCGGGCGC